MAKSILSILKTLQKECSPHFWSNNSKDLFRNALKFKLKSYKKLYHEIIRNLKSPLILQHYVEAKKVPQSGTSGIIFHSYCNKGLCAFLLHLSCRIWLKFNLCLAGPQSDKFSSSCSICQALGFSSNDMYSSSSTLKHLLLGHFALNPNQMNEISEGP